MKRTISLNGTDLEYLTNTLENQMRKISKNKAKGVPTPRDIELNTKRVFRNLLVAQGISKNPRFKKYL